MKRLSIFTILLFVISFCFSSNAKSAGFGFVFGLSTPNDQVNNVYNGNPFSSVDSLKNWFKGGLSSGFHIGVKARFGMSDNLTFVGGIAWHRFPESQINIKSTTSENISINITENIIPISAGVNLYLVKSIIGLYGVGELTYNYISSNAEVNTPNGYSLPIIPKPNPKDSRVGFGLGIGADLDVKIITLNLEGKYNIANLIGAASDEKTKAYFSLSLGAFF
jgi:hypothetical protein